MFCDVRNFTAISESLDPRQLADLLNALFTPLTSILYKHRGTVDKYMGDAVMAFWGAPIADAHHARNALLAAFEIQDMLANLAPDFNKRGWPRISMGIGLNSGIMNVGIMGSRYRMTYTAVGDAVNLAARLQDLTRVYNTDIIIGEGTRKAFPSAFYRELGLVQVKGKDTPARIFEPCNPAADPDSTIVRDMHRHNEALRRYYLRDWDQSETLFQSLHRTHPEDTLYPLYLERIAEYRKNPPPADWKGEVRYTIR
jgi:adenylate cyclase